MAAKKLIKTFFNATKTRYTNTKIIKLEFLNRSTLYNNFKFINKLSLFKTPKPQKNSALNYIIVKYIYPIIIVIHHCIITNPIILRLLSG